METTEFFMENWYLFAAFFAVLFSMGLWVGRFLKLPSKKQEEKVKQWLIWAVSRAEAELGAGEGQMKLRRVYDAFLKRFPVVAEAVSFKTFGRWVDGALAEVQAMLVQKKAAEQKKGGGSIDK